MMRPLFECYPALKERLAHQELADLPTPVQSLPVTENAWIKRDDLTHPDYGGNKIRKLEFILADFLQRNGKKLVTFGAIGTNHGVATAMLCRELKIPLQILLFDQPVTPTVKQNLQLMQSFGAELMYCGSLAKTVAAYYLHSGRFKPGYYFLFAGGSNIPGTLAFVNAALELREQIDQGLLPEPEAIVCATGSSATLAGLTLGISVAGMKTAVRGVRVAPSHLGPFDACTTKSVNRLMLQVAGFLEKNSGQKMPVLPGPVLDDCWFGDGYGQATQEGNQATELFFQAGIVLEPTYTAKAAAAFLDLCKKTTGPCLYWHTYNSRDTHKMIDTDAIDKLPARLQSRLKAR